MSIANPTSFGVALANIVGVDPSRVTRITVDVPAQMIPTITIELLADALVGEELVMEVRRYELREDPGWTAQESARGWRVSR